MQLVGHEALPRQRYGEHDGLPVLLSESWSTVHCPTKPVLLQTSHEPVHAALQQTPSAQWPLTHSLPPAHACPFVFFGTHAPAAQ